MLGNKMQDIFQHIKNGRLFNYIRDTKTSFISNRLYPLSFMIYGKHGLDVAICTPDLDSNC